MRTPNIVNKQNASEVEVIILTASGGSGHLSAAEQEKKKHVGKKCLVINVIEMGWLNFEWVKKYGLDILYRLPYIESFLLYNYGKEGVAAWDLAQKTGDLATLNKLISQQNLANKAFGENFFAKMSNLLNKYPKTKLVVTTQPLGISDIHRSIAAFNKQKLLLEATKFSVIMTDLPSTHAVHFFNSLKLINDKELPWAELNFITPYPAIRASSPCLADYHHALSQLCPKLYVDNTGIPKQHISIDFNMGPVDQAFIDIRELINEKGTEFVQFYYKKTPVPLQFTPEAYQQVSKLPLVTAQLTDPDKKPSGTDLVKNGFNIPADAQVITLMLGSQAAKQGTLEVINFEYALHKKTKSNPDQKTCLFVFCGNDTSEQSLFARVCAKAQEYQDEGKFIIVPLTNQTKLTISHLYCIAATSIIRAGGMSVMELEAVSNAKVVIFAEPGKLSAAQLRMDPSLTLIVWEKGNAEHIQIKFGIDTVNILNAEMYIEGRIKQLSRGNTRNPYASFIIDPEICAYANEKLEAECIKTSLINHIDDMNSLLAGCAIYKSRKPMFESNEDMINYAQEYARGCKLIINKQTLISLPINADSQQIKHPNNWAVRFADFTQDLLPETESHHITDKQYEFAKAFTNAFYEPSLEILFRNEALIYAQAYMTKSQDPKEAREFAINTLRQKQARTDKVTVNFMDLNQTAQLIPSPYYAQWEKGKNLAEKIIILFQDYINPRYSYYFFSLHPFRHEQRRALEIITVVNKLVDRPAKEILEFLRKYKRECSSETKATGSFMKRLNFAIQMTAAADFYDHHNAAKFDPVTKGKTQPQARTSL